jgi:hypothetical protein
MFLDLAFLKREDGTLSQDWVDLSRVTFNGPVACDHTTSLICKKMLGASSPSERRRNLRILGNLPEIKLQQEGVHSALLQALEDTSGEVREREAGPVGLKNSHFAALRLGSLLEPHSASTYQLCSRVIRSFALEQFVSDIPLNKRIVTAESAIWAMNAIKRAGEETDASRTSSAPKNGAPLLKDNLTLTRPNARQPTYESLRHSLGQLLSKRQDLQAPFEAAVYADAATYRHSGEGDAWVLLGYVDLATCITHRSWYSKQMAADGYELLLRNNGGVRSWYDTMLPWIISQLDSFGGDVVAHMDLVSRAVNMPSERICLYLDNVLAQIGLDDTAALALLLFDGGHAPALYGWFEKHLPHLAGALQTIHQGLSRCPGRDLRADICSHAREIVADQRSFDSYLLTCLLASRAELPLKFAALKGLEQRLEQGADPRQIERGITLLLLDDSLKSDLREAAEHLLKRVWGVSKVPVC